MILIVGTPKKGTPIFGNPHMGSRSKEIRDRATAAAHRAKRRAPESPQATNTQYEIDNTLLTPFYYE